MKKHTISLFATALVFLTGCTSSNPTPSLTPTVSTTPDGISETPVPTVTVTPTATPDESPVPTSVPDKTYQPIQVTYAPNEGSTASPTSTPEVINHAPVFDLNKMGSLIFQVKENGVAGSDSQYTDANQIISGKDSFSFQIAASDPDKDTISYYISEATGSSALRELETHYGKVSVDVLGKVSYTLKENPELNQKEKAVDFFMIRVVDANGFYSEAQITVNIEGTNSAPQINTPDTVRLSVPAQGSQAVQGKLNIQDLDNDAACGGWIVENYAFNLDDANTLTVSQPSFSFSIDAFGVWSLTIQANQSAGTLSIPLIYKDNHGSSCKTVLNFEIAENTPPTVEMETTYSANKEADIKAMIEAQINAYDADNDSLSYRIKNWDSLTKEFNSGILVINPETSSFHFTVSDAITKGTYIESFTLIISDGIHNVEKEITLNITVLSYKEKTTGETEIKNEE